MAKLTAIAVENIKPGPRRREIPDSGCQGLYLVVQPSGRKSWAVRYRFQGTPRKLTLDGALTLATARKAATDALHVLERGHDPAAAKKSAKVRAEFAAANTLRAVTEAYLVDEERKPADKRLRTIASASRHLRAADLPGAWRQTDRRHQARRHRQAARPRRG